MSSSAVISGDPVAAASAVAMQHARDDKPRLQRNGRGKRARYARANGKPMRDEATLRRIRALAIPRAWTDVWSADPNGHIQATGRGARGCRKSYVHPQLFEDFNKLGELAKHARRVAKTGNRAIDIDALLAIEPAVLKYLARSAP